MRRCEDEKMRDRSPLLEEPCAQTLSGKNNIFIHVLKYHRKISNELFELRRKILPGAQPVRQGAGRLPLWEAGSDRVRRCLGPKIAGVIVQIDLVIFAQGKPMGIKCR